MDIHIRADHQIRAAEAHDIPGARTSTPDIEAKLVAALKRFGERVIRVDVHLSDENSQTKSGPDDKRCVIEAHLAGLPRVSVSHHGATVDQVLDGAIDKLRQLLDHTIGKRERRRARTANAEQAIPGGGVE